MTVKNSASSISDNLIKLQRNNTELLTKLSDVINSDADIVTLKIEDIQNGNVKSISVPSIGSLKKDIQRIDENIQQLSNLNGTDASVKLADGIYRTIIKSTLKKSADSLTTVQTPDIFNSKSNWFFESFLNPYLYVSLDFSSQLNPDTRQVKMQKFILNLDTDDKLTIFNEEIKNNPDLSYSNFLELINNSGITYVIDDDILDLPPIEPRYYGDFSVMRVFEENEEVLIDGLTANKKHLKFQLDKLTFNDKNSSILETQQLKIGDSFLVNKNDRNTRYFITNIDFETTTVSVELAEGYDSVNIGSNNLSYYPDEDIVPEVRVGIGFNEYLSVFIKPIDPNSNRPADNFSPNISFYTNDLTIQDTDGQLKKFETYYKESVVDFGAFIFSLAKENIPPVSKGIVPDAPELLSDDFKVTQINKHATDVQSNEDIKTLNKEKNKLKAELEELDKAISRKRQESATKNYKSDIERETDSNQLNNLINKRGATETLYNSVVNDILTKASDKTTTAEKAKYRIRGFWPLPAQKTALDGSLQDIIQFKIEYRYLTKGGAANNLDEFDVTDSDGNTSKGVYSNWNKFTSDLRERAIDEETGQFYWVAQDIENGEAVNINQLDIPIQPNETVEIRIKSISEAGYPTTPLESVWSNVMSIPFPEDLGVSKDILAIAKETMNEQSVVELNANLTEKGVFTHIDDQFSQNNTLWKHQAYTIASGFLSAERNVISLFDYLKQQEQTIAELQAKIDKTLGVLIVKIEDEGGNQIIVQNNSVTSIFAGNYKDEVSSLDKPKGVIVSKNYFLRIENDAATPIELIAGIDGAQAGSKFERATGQYINPPIGLSNPTIEDLNNTVDNTAYILPGQSSQVKGQFLYVREKDVTNTKTLFTSEGTFYDNIYSMDTNITGATANYKNDETYFVWDGTPTTTNEISGVEPFVFDTNKTYVHCEHPDLQNGITTSGVLTGTNWLFENTSISKYANLRFANNVPYYQQSSFIFASANSEKISNRISFTENDSYLMGPASCGSYLYIVPIKYNDIRVDGNDTTSTKPLVSTDSEGGLAFQLVYQYRMTDYFGPGTGDIGRIGGEEGITQLEYRKTLGFDLFYDNSKFSFDLEISSRYKSNGLSTSDVPTLTYQNTINQTTNNVNQITPSI